MTESHIGDVNLTFLKTLFSLFEPAIKSVINIVMAKGIDFAWVLSKFGINFLEFEKTMLKPMEDYFLFYITLHFNLEALDGSIQSFLEDSFYKMTSDDVINDIASQTVKRKVSEYVN